MTLDSTSVTFILALCIRAATEVARKMDDCHDYHGRLSHGGQKANGFLGATKVSGFGDDSGIAVVQNKPKG